MQDQGQNANETEVIVISSDARKLQIVSSFAKITKKYASQQIFKSAKLGRVSGNQPENQIRSNPPLLGISSIDRKDDASKFQIIRR